MDWKQMIPGCFGDQNGIFALHPADERRAEELKGMLRDQHISNQDIEEAFEDWLAQRHGIYYNRKEQMDKINKFFCL